MDKYKTGDVTVTSHCVRLYVVENGISGYFHWSKGSPTTFLHRTLDSEMLNKAPSEPVMCSIDDLLQAVWQTYGKEIR